MPFVVSSRPCSEGFSPGSPGFLPPQKSTYLNSNSIGNSRATGLSVSVRLLCVTLVYRLSLNKALGLNMKMNWRSVGRQTNSVIVWLNATMLFGWRAIDEYRKILIGDLELRSMGFNKLKYGIKSWRYQAARLWNTIPNYLRNIDTYRSFKRGLKELDIVGL